MLGSCSEHRHGFVRLARHLLRSTLGGQARLSQCEVTRGPWRESRALTFLHCYTHRPPGLPLGTWGHCFSAASRAGLPPGARRRGRAPCPQTPGGWAPQCVRGHVLRGVEGRTPLCAVESPVLEGEHASALSRNAGPGDVFVGSEKAFLLLLRDTEPDVGASAQRLFRKVSSS